MGTNEIVSEIISAFTKELEQDEAINKDFIKKVTETLNGTAKVTSVKIETLLYDESDKL